MQIVNFRDFGGRADSAGRRVLRDRLYRSGRLASTDAASIDRLLALDFGLIADLRYKREREGAASPWPSWYSGRVLAHDLEQDLEAPHVRLLRAPAVDEQAIEAFYLDFYQTLPFDPPYVALFGEFFRRLATNTGRTLIHCSIGKDRTGLLAALVLHALGVPRETIVADYMVSRAAPGLIELVPEVERILRRQLDRVVPSRVAERLLSVEESYLLAAFQAIESRCGSLNDYLQLIGCGGQLRAQLQARLLE